jgi:hypothetical protein
MTPAAFSRAWLGASSLPILSARRVRTRRDVIPRDALSHRKMMAPASVSIRIGS